MTASQRLDAHFVAAMGVLAEHATDRGVRERGDGLVVTAVGTGGSEFNTAWVTARPGDPDAAVRWGIDLLEATGQPFTIQVPEPLLGAVREPLATAGLGLRVTVPGMARAVTTRTPATPPGLRITRVEDEPTLEDHAVAAATGFGVPDPRSGIALFPPSLLDDERVILFNGYVDGAPQPAATAVTVVAADIAGVYAITVHEHARRRGFGEAMTWAAVAAGDRAGVEVAALQATAMGEPLYARMGFEALRPYHRFAPVQTDAEGPPGG